MPYLNLLKVKNGNCLETDFILFIDKNIYFENYLYDQISFNKIFEDYISLNDIIQIKFPSQKLLNYNINFIPEKFRKLLLFECNINNIIKDISIQNSPSIYKFLIYSSNYYLDGICLLENLSKYCFDNGLPVIFTVITSDPNWYELYNRPNIEMIFKFNLDSLFDVNIDDFCYVIFNLSYVETVKYLFKCGDYCLGSSGFVNECLFEVDETSTRNYVNSHISFTSSELNIFQFEKFVKEQYLLGNLEFDVFRLKKIIDNIIVLK